MNPEEQDERCGLASASSWERVHFCPGSVPLIATLPPELRESNSGEVAESGTRIHDAIEMDDDSDLNMTEVEIKDRLVVLENDAVNQFAKDHSIEPFSRESDGIREQRLWVLDENFEKITSAKLDVYYTRNGYGLALDFKSGFKRTTAASRNLQLKVQAVALAYQFGLKHVRVAIAQHRFQSFLTQADYDEAALSNAYLEILQDQWRSQQPDAPRVPGSHCTYCPAKSSCPEAATYALLPSRDVFGKPKKEQIALSVANLTLEELAFIERRRTVSEGIFAAVKARLKTMPAEELAKVGLELRPGNKQSAVVDLSGLANYLYGLKDNLLINEEEFNACFGFKIGTLEEAILPKQITNAEAQGVKLTAKAAKEQLRASLAPFINWEASRGEPVLKEKE